MGVSLSLKIRGHLWSEHQPPHVALKWTWTCCSVSQCSCLQNHGGLLPAIYCCLFWTSSVSPVGLGFLSNAGEGCGGSVIRVGPRLSTGTTTHMHSRPGTAGQKPCCPRSQKAQVPRPQSLPVCGAWRPQSLTESLAHELSSQGHAAS